MLILPRSLASSLTLVALVALTVGFATARRTWAGDSGLAARPGNPSCVAPPRPFDYPNVKMVQLFANIVFDNGVELVNTPDGSEWFLVERSGRVIQFPNDTLTTIQHDVLDLASKLVFTSTNISGPNVDSQQWGLTSMALHPSFATNGYMYLAYNAKPAATDPVHSILSRFTYDHVSGTANALSEVVLLDVAQTDPWHHFGRVVFGLDEYLYVGSGDGGSYPGPSNILSHPAQDPFSLKGKMLRLDVDSNSPYGIPPDNPYVASGLGAPEVFALGLRNPWRFSFDRATGDLYVGDVGWSDWEEINIIESGKNYGWPIKEGPVCTYLPCDGTGLEEPYHTYNHDVGRAAIGGYVYRGAALPDLDGLYLFGDTRGYTLWALEPHPSGIPARNDLTRISIPMTNMSEDINGELYTLRFNTARILGLVPNTGAPPTSGFPETLEETGCVDPVTPTNVVAGLIPYDVISPLWSDGVDKNRWMALPDGEQISLDDEGDFVFPVGTVLMKQFSSDGVPFETRLFVRHDDGGWGGYTYEWRSDLSGADHVPDGKTKVLPNGLTWHYPTQGQCFGCHTQQASFALGPETLQLNADMTYPSTGITANQMHTLDHIGLFDGPLAEDVQDLPALADPLQVSVPVSRRAKSYLHANCAGCHRPDGAAQANVDFLYPTPVDGMNVCNEFPTQGDGGVAGAKILVPGDPLLSLISIRMRSLDSLRMPPIGTTVVHTEGADVIDTWINSPGVCDPFVDSDGDGVDDGVDNCMSTSNTAQTDWNLNGLGDRCEDWDEDGLLDGTEIYVLSSSPDDSDSDDDSLPDGDEVNIYLTNPVLADTDGDGVDDDVEIDVGTDPTNPESFPQAVPAVDMLRPLLLLLMVGLALSELLGSSRRG